DAGHAPRYSMRDFGTLALTAPDQFAEVIGLVVEACRFKRNIKFDDPTVNIADGCPHRIPPVLVNRDVAARAAQQRIALAREIEPGVELGHAALMLGLEQREVVDAGGVESPHSLHALYRT